MASSANDPAALAPTFPAAPPALVQAWIGLMLSPIAWVADFLARYLVVRWANLHDVRWPPRLSTAAAVLMVLAGAAISRHARRTARAPATVSAVGEAAAQRMATLAGWGLLLAAFFLLLILAESFPTFVLGPREIT